MKFDEKGIGTSEDMNQQGMDVLFKNWKRRTAEEERRVLYEKCIVPNWGSRGNPVFWDMVNERIKGRTINTRKELIDFVCGMHLEVVGKPMTETSFYYCKKLAKGEGMSDGWINGKQWFEKDGSFDKLCAKYGLK